MFEKLESTVKKVERLKSGKGWFVTLANGAAKYVKLSVNPRIGQRVSAKVANGGFRGGSTAEWTFHK